ncbi:DHHA1 domain-containing protein [Streptomyces yunnanensis]|uniref:DHHA1 domain-containing protein n=1 Tax=Streptomyces yunnanensis TaxID=156453 RepID=UPI00330730DC
MRRHPRRPRLPGRHLPPAVRVLDRLQPPPRRSPHRPQHPPPPRHRTTAAERARRPARHPPHRGPRRPAQAPGSIGDRAGKAVPAADRGTAAPGRTARHPCPAGRTGAAGRPARHGHRPGRTARPRRGHPRTTRPRPRRRDPRREHKGKALLASAISPDLHQAGTQASQILAEAARTVGGGSGGRGPLASAGGRHPEALNEALDLAAPVATRLLSNR